MNERKKAAATTTAQNKPKPNRKYQTKLEQSSRNSGLITFLRGSSNPEKRTPGCANFNRDDNNCLFDQPCKVLEGNRCGYFERAVLPSAADTGKLEKISRLYEKQTGKVTKTGRQQRYCPDCGRTLPKRRRVCDDCRSRRRKETYRKSRRDNGK